MQLNDNVHDQMKSDRKLISSDKSDIQTREIEFHDHWAISSSDDDVLVQEYFESPLAPENQLALRLMGDLRGKKILDVATGLGEAAVYFSLHGAEVTAVDISPKMISHAIRLAKKNGTSLKTRTCPVEKLALPDNHFDICYSANLIHHTADIQQILKEMHRVLRPNGLLITWDPLSYNPIINIYRRIASAMRTPDEKPLKFGSIRQFEKLFDDVSYQVFWLTSLVIFLKYFFFDRIHPNSDRYWRRILREGPNVTKWLAPLMALDHKLLQFSPLKYLAWTILISGRKKDSNSS